jgi:hypothetical protein
MTASERVLDGPPGCWEVVGRASWSHDFGALGSTRGDAVFSGRLRDGVWGEIAIFPLGTVDRARGEAEEGPEVYASDQRFTPLIGQVRGLAVSLDRTGAMQVRRSSDPRVDPVNTVRDVIDRLSRGAETVFARWDEPLQAVVLERDRTVGKVRSPLSMSVVFPDGGTTPAAWTLHLERPYHHDALGLVRVSALDVDLRFANDGLPQSEQMSTRLSIAGASFTASQRLVYTSVRACGG